MKGLIAEYVRHKGSYGGYDRGESHIKIRIGRLGDLLPDYAYALIRDVAPHGYMVRVHGLKDRHDITRSGGGAAVVPPNSQLAELFVPDDTTSSMDAFEQALREVLESGA